MSGSNVAHVSSVDKGLKMKIKRTKGPNKVDSKHEVVKSDSLSKSAISASGQSMASVAVTMLSSTAASSSTMMSAVTTASGSGNSTPFILEASTPSLLLSTSAILPSSCNNLASSLVTLTAANPTVALLKAVTAGIVSEVYSSNSVALTNKSPLKIISPGMQGTDQKDGKSHKIKAAYNKKAKDIKGKADGFVNIGPTCSVSGPHIANTDSRTSVCSVSNSQALNYATSPFPSHAGVINSTVTSEPRPGDTVHMKRENPVHDPYEFNAKVEDKIELPPKKLKLEKTDCIETAISPQPPQPQQHSSSPAMLQPPPPPKQQQQPQKRSVGVDVRSVGVDVRSVGVVTEPDALGPCEPGTLVGLEGIVWKETDNGLLVVNVTWRGKTYVGTLMDATRYAWAPPRPNGCESPVSDLESRAPKGRGRRNCRNSVQSNERLPEGRRLRKGRRGTVNSSSSNFTAPPSPAKSDVSTNNLKRKAKPNDVDSDKPKRSRSCSRGVTGADSPTPDGYIVCPEPNCHKKYKHMNGLRYHRTHAHRKSSLTDDAKDDEDEDGEEEEKLEKKEKTAINDRTEKMKAKERQKVQEQQRISGRDSKDSLDDDIPLKEIASKVSGQITVHKDGGVSTSKDRGEEETSSNSNDGSSSGIITSSISGKVDPQVGITTSSISGKVDPQVGIITSSISGKVDPLVGIITSSISGKVDPQVGITTSFISGKVDLQVVLTKADIPVQKEAMPPSIVCTPTSKKKDSSLVDVPISSSTLVPCIPSSESPVVVSSDGGNIILPAMTTVRSQVYNKPSTSAAPGVSLIMQACPTLSLVSAHTLPLTSTTGITSTTTPTSVLGITMSSDRHNAGKSSGFMKSARLIVPAPPHQISGSGNCHQLNMSSLSSMQCHGSTLKPIQPKPTVMGDYSSVNPALSDLSKEKQRKAKRRKDALETATLGSTNPCLKGQGSSRESTSTLLDMPSHDDLYKCERTAVIKSSNPSKLYETSSPISDLSKLSFQSSLNAHKLQCSLNAEATLTVGSRIAIPPSSLHVPVSSNSDNKSTVNDDVHSPAYSDISDANDSSSPLQQDSPKKDSSLKKDGQLNGPSHMGPDNSSLPQHYGNIFYYGGPHYLPHGINPQMASPTLSEGMIKKEDVEEKKPSSSNENLLDKKDVTRCAQEADVQQKSLINYIAHLHGVSPAAMQLQYNLTGYNPMAMDSSYAALTHQALDQQKRLMQHHDMGTKAEDGSAKRTPSGTQSTNRPVRSGFEPSGKLNVGADMIEGHYDQRRSSGDRDHLLRDKHGDIHHTLKENNELKSQMGPSHDQQSYHSMKQQHNDLLRAQMYQQQQQKMYESHRRDKRKSPPELTNTGPHPSGLISRNQPDSKPLELIPHDMIKKEVIHHKDSSRLDAIDSKRFDIKEESIKPGQSSSSLDMTCTSRSPSQPNIPQASSTSSSSSSSLSSSAAASLPVSLVGSLPSTAAGFPYTSYYPHFRPVQLDSMYRALSPHIIGYASAPQGFIHPSQLGYRMPVVDTDGKPSDTTESLRGDGPGLASSPGYAPVHKIHELHDKGRPSPGVHSPAPNKSTTGDNLNSTGSTTPGPPGEKVKDKQREYTNSPPTQRHVHTHHHTHVVSGFTPLYTPDAYTMFGHPAAAAAAATIQAAPHSFPPPPPPPAPKS